MRGRSLPIPARLTAGVVLLGLAGCAGSAPPRGLGPSETDDRRSPPAAPPVALECEPLGPAAGGMDTLVVALPDACDPARAPLPRTDADRVVFRQLYETLVRLDCDGTPRPGLAEAWSCDPGGQRWTFTLRAGARFWDGRPVTATAVREAWSASGRRAHADGCPGPWAWLEVEDASVQALDARRLAIALPEPQPDFPLLLAHPAFAVARHREGTAWPLGSGPWMPVAMAGDSLACAPSPHAAARPLAARLVFRMGVATADGLPLGADLALARDAGASTAGAHALPPDRIHLLLRPGGGAADSLDVPDPGAPERAADPFFPGSRGGGCPQLAAPTATPATAAGTERPADLAWPDDDPLAGRLAAALAGRAGLTPVAVPAAAWAARLRDGASAAFLVPARRCLPTTCLQLATLLSAAPWLREAALGGEEESPRRIAALLRAEGFVVPVAMSGPALLARPGVGGVRIDYDGTPRFAASAP